MEEEWYKDSIVVVGGGHLSNAKAQELAQRGVYLLTATRKHMRSLASQCQLACLQLRHRVEGRFACLKEAFGAVRTTHWAAYALPIHLLCCLLAYSLYKSSIAQRLSPGIALVVTDTHQTAAEQFYALVV